MSRKVVVTGLGAISPIGDSAESMWENALAGVSGVRNLEAEWVEQYDLPVRFAGQVSSPISESPHVSKVEAKRMDPSGQFAVHAARQAWEDAGFTAADAEQASVPLGSGGTATAHWSERLGAAVLVTSGLADPGSSKTYELWFVRGAEPVPAGVFDPDDGNATALLQGDLRPGDVIAVTVEQEGGSPSGAPTTDPVIVIPTA